MPIRLARALTTAANAIWDRLAAIYLDALHQASPG